MIKSIFVLLLFSATALAQTDPIGAYLSSVSCDLESDGEDLEECLPGAQNKRFADYVVAVHMPSEPGAISDWRSLIRFIESRRLNKMVGQASGGSGTTSLVSSVAVPAVIGFGLERGGILQSSSSTVTSFRANALGLAKLAVGAEQFPYCPEVNAANCGSWTRRLRRFSGSVSFENSTSSGQLPILVDNPLGNGYRMSSWGVRFDLTPSSNLDDPKYVKAWHDNVKKLRGTDVVDRYGKAIEDYVGSHAADISDDEGHMADVLRETPKEERKKTMKMLLDWFIKRRMDSDPNFFLIILEMQQSAEAYYMARDEAVRDAQTHKMSIEYMNLHPVDEPSRSTVRFIYSHQPTNAPLLVTVNFAASFYNGSVADAGPSRFRDIQFAAQLDRRLPQIGKFQNPTLTLAAYYQWMKEDALLSIPAENLTPETAIPLPDNASVLLGTQGHIGIVQAKLSFPIGEHLRVPLSITWANRTELIKESDVRGQVGFTFDMDSFFQ